MYPPNEKRAALNEAFDSLDDFIKHPQKLVSLLVNAFKIMFKYGRHLPKIVQAGLGAMKTFRAATNFENNLVNEAIKNGVQAPFDTEKIEALIKLLPRIEIESFIESSKNLFEVLHDKELIKKIKEVIQHLIDSMQKNSTVYSKSQIKGLQIGLEMITEGDALFNQLSEKEQQNLINLITDIEKSHLERIF
tara:strand:- start:2561 stop:3133 length:573 start_codon:yes stop_codon:yes gene_type:complete